MKISVRVKHIVIKLNDGDNNPVIKYESHNNEVQKTLRVMCEEAKKLLKEDLT
jgi:hypothetical protein